MIFYKKFYRIRDRPFTAHIGKCRKIEAVIIIKVITIRVRNFPDIIFSKDFDENFWNSKKFQIFFLIMGV